MQIETGLFENMVLQRNAKDVSDAVITGTCDAVGRVEARVLSNGKTLKGFGWKKIGKAAAGSFEATLKGLPAGGPYTVKLRVAATAGDSPKLTVDNVLVGDVWVLAGQSNMQGCGNAEDDHKGHDEVRGFFMDDRWDRAADPLHNMWDAVDDVHHRIAGGKVVKPERIVKGVGPGVSFAVAMRKLTSVPQGVIAAAHGGTSMSQWDPEAHKGKGKQVEKSTLYSATIRRAQKNGGKVAGIVWYQGESDASQDAAAVYTQRMVELVAAFRKDLDSPKLPFSLVQIGRVVLGGWQSTWWNSVQDQERRLPEVINRLSVTPAIDLTLDDGIHISGVDQHRLGKRLAEAAYRLTKGKRRLPAEPTIKKISIANLPAGGSEISVQYRNVVGQLVSRGRPAGFSIPDAGAGAGFFKIKLDGDTVRLHCMQPSASMEQTEIYYGRGLDPYCNITDEADRSLPVTGPIQIGAMRAVTPFVQSVRVSPVLPSGGTLDSLPLPSTSGKSKMKPRTFEMRLLDRHEEWSAAKNDDPYVVYACRFKCSELMMLEALVGYDGPVRVWVDDRELLHDPAGANPAVEDARSLPFEANVGEHEIIIALGSNKKRAWGVFLRLERMDVPAKLVEAGPEHYVMPELLD